MQLLATGSEAYEGEDTGDGAYEGEDAGDGAYEGEDAGDGAYDGVAVGAGIDTCAGASGVVVGFALEGFFESITRGID